MRSRLPLLLLLIALAAVLAVLGVRVARADDAPTMIEHKDIDTCLGCHNDKVNVDHWKNSAHGKLVCQDCHKGIDRVPHPENAPGKHPQCVSCHADKGAALGHSVHAAAKDASGKPISCQTCHGGNPHEVHNPKTLPPAQQEAACRNCHADKVAALRGSVHAGVKGCLACHGGNAHGITTPPKAGPALNAFCERCHAADIQKMLNGAHGQALKRTDKPLSCLACHGGQNAHAITPPPALTGAAKEAMCEKCHADKAQALQSSVHGNVNMQAGTRPNCLYCHGAQFHSVAAATTLTPAQQDAPCRSCHTDKVKELAQSVHGTAGTSCLACHGGNPHKIKAPETLPTAEKIAGCAACHADKVKQYLGSVHGKADKQPGDHPTCFTCHGENPHTIAKSPAPTPQQKVTLCARCHANGALMARYGRTDAVDAYSKTYHGRAIMQFHHTKEATCVDCHGIHGVMNPDDPTAPTNMHHAAEICGKCHKDKRMDFAYSYASHLRVNLEKSSITPLTNLYLRLLSLNPALYPPALLLLGLLHYRVRRRRRTAANGVRVIFWALNLFSLFAAVITGASIWFMNLKLPEIGNPDVPAKMFWPMVFLAVTASLGLILSHFIVPEEK